MKRIKITNSLEYKINDKISISKLPSNPDYLYSYGNELKIFPYYEYIFDALDERKKYVAKDLSDSEFIIYNISENKEGVYFKISKGFFKKNYFIFIYGAIRKSEIELFLKLKTEKNYFCLKKNTSFISYYFLQNKEIPIEEYLFRFKKNDFTRTINNEFKHKKLIDETKKEINKSISKFHEENLFSINITLEFGEYDFNLKGFNLKSNLINNGKLLVPFLSGTNELVKRFGKLVYYKYNQLFFIFNFKDFNFFNLSEKKAKVLIDNIYLRDDRMVYVKLFFKISKKFSSNDIRIIDDERIINGIISKIEIYESPTLTSNLLAIIKA